MLPPWWVLVLAVTGPAVVGWMAWRHDARRNCHAQAQRAREVMHDALLWYADASHWRRRHPRGDRHWARCPAMADRGARAARALNQLQEPRHGR